MKESHLGLISSIKLVSQGHMYLLSIGNNGCCYISSEYRGKVRLDVCFMGISYINTIKSYEKVLSINYTHKHDTYHQYLSHEQRKYPKLIRRYHTRVFSPQKPFFASAKSRLKDDYPSVVNVRIRKINRNLSTGYRQYYHR